MKIFEILQENNGRYSSTRFLFVLWGLGLLTLWLYNGFVTKTIPAIDITVLGIIATFMTGKVVQKGLEHGKDTN